MLNYDRGAMRILRPFISAAAVAVSLVLAACGGGGGGGGGGSIATAVTPSLSSTAPNSSAPPTSSSSGSDPNVVPIVLDGGTTGQAFNSPYVTVTVCTPGTSACQQIDHVLLDTGSFGLRLLASVLEPATQLPNATAPNGGQLAECAPFASGFAWGSVRTADVRIGGEVAARLPIQVVNDTAIHSPPSSCTAMGGNFGTGGNANGILGVGVLTQDCGVGCAASASSGIYYSCNAGGCTASIAPLTSQVANPVPSFATDNNGVAVTLPNIPLAGAATSSGTLIFGVGTRANNQLGAATVFATDSQGSLSVVYKGTRYSSFFDTGSNALFFPDPSLTPCPDGNGFYCPGSPQTLTATITSVTGVARQVDFTINGLQSVSSSATVAPIAGSPSGMGNVFDWGLPFFFGRTVFVAMTGAATPAGVGPYLAF
jgi:hypothetical protein